MEIFDCLPQTGTPPTAVALGFFDGVHRAHAAMIRAAVRDAAEHGLVPAVFTFRLGAGEMPPNKPELRMIWTPKQRLDRMQALGVRQVYQPEFTSIAGLSPEKFLCLLRDRLRVGMLSCGYDYTFGRGAQGTTDQLRKFCEAEGIRLQVLPPVLEGGEPVSSTGIRKRLAEGDIPGAERLLGGPYEIEGEVLPGRHLGHTLGFPTINQAFCPEQALPRFGVYRSSTILDGKQWNSITNVGVKPTIPGERMPVAETHMLGAEGDFYGKWATVRLMDLMRPEMRFESVEALREQVLRDIASR